MFSKSLIALALALASTTPSLVTAVPVDVSINIDGLQGSFLSCILVYYILTPAIQLAREATATQAKYYHKREEEFLQGTDSSLYLT